MVQSSDLARISTVQSTDFLGNPDLAEDLSKSSSGSEEFIYFVWVSVWWREPWLPFTQSMFLWQTVTAVFLCFWGLLSEHIDLNADLWPRSVSDFILVFYSYSSSSWNPHVFGGKSLDFLVNPWINPQIVRISLNPWIYQIIWGP